LLHAIECLQSSTQLYLSVAGLVPATHVFAVHSADRQEGVDGRAKPGQGGYPALCKQRAALQQDKKEGKVG
jgi:hypothetical protein